MKPNQYLFYLSIALVVFSLIIELALRPKADLKIPFPFLMLILIASGLQSLANAKVFSDGFIYFSSTIIVPVLAVFVVANAEYREDNLITWSKWLVVVGTILGFIGIVIAILNPTERIGSLWVTAMNINGFYLLVFFLAIGLLLQSRNLIAKYLYVIAAFAVFGGMLYTYTRVTLIAGAFGFFLLILRVKKLRKLFFLFIVLTPLVIPSSMMSRLEIGLTSDVSILIRILAWTKALNLIENNFLLGIGFDTWKHTYMSMIPYKILYAVHPHNVYLRVMVETGVLGFFAYFSLIVLILVQYYRRFIRLAGSYYDYAVFVSVMSVLFACLTDVFIQQYSVSLPFWITLALMYQKTINPKLETYK